MGRKRATPEPVRITWPGKERPDAPLAVGADDLRIVERVRPLSDGAQGELFEGAEGAADSGSRAEREPVNLLVRGDNAVVMAALTERLRDGVDLIYIDPPFATGLHYYGETGRGGASMQRRVYRDTLEGGLAGYADMMYRRLRQMRELLSDNGKLFVHCDWRASAVLRLTLDELFGPACFRNEIIWRRAPNLGRQAASKQLGRVFDSILVYSKTEGARFAGAPPRRRALVPLDGKGKPKGARWDDERELYFTTAPRGDYTDKSIERLRGEGRVYETSKGTVYIKYFLTKGEDGRWYKEQPVDALWDDYDVRPLRHRPKAEAMGYDTQKPEGLLERIIGWATEPGDRVADFFCGSGTTAAVAHRLGRRWVACDQQPTAIELTRRRLLGQGARFDVASVLGAERRLWRQRETGGVPAVLTAFGAEATEVPWGEKDGAAVWVAGSEGPATAPAILAACKETDKDRLVALAHAWAPDDARALRRVAAVEHGVELTMRTIPVDLLRGRASGPADFVERTEVDLSVDRREGSASVRLLGVRCDNPTRLREDKSNRANKHELTELSWSDFVDTWRIDFSGGDTFCAQWQGARTVGEFMLESPRHKAQSKIRVRVVTVFGDLVERWVAC